jgi:zinc protease
MEIGTSEIVGVSWKKVDGMIEKIKAVTSSQVQEVAKKYFIDDRLTIGVLDPQPLDPQKKMVNDRAAASIKH